jgi:hypothetical protein
MKFSMIWAKAFYEKKEVMADSSSNPTFSDYIDSSLPVINENTQPPGWIVVPTDEPYLGSQGLMISAKDIITMSNNHKIKFIYWLYKEKVVDEKYIIKKERLLYIPQYSEMLYFAVYIDANRYPLEIEVPKPNINFNESLMKMREEIQNMVDLENLRKRIEGKF